MENSSRKTLERIAIPALVAVAVFVVLGALTYFVFRPLYYKDLTDILNSEKVKIPYKMFADSKGNVKKENTEHIDKLELLSLYTTLNTFYGARFDNLALGLDYKFVSIIREENQGKLSFAAIVISNEEPVLRVKNNQEIIFPGESYGYGLISLGHVIGKNVPMFFGKDASVDVRIFSSTDFIITAINPTEPSPKVKPDEKKIPKDETQSKHL